MTQWDNEVDGQSPQVEGDTKVPKNGGEISNLESEILNFSHWLAGGQYIKSEVINASGDLENFDKQVPSSTGSSNRYSTDCMVIHEWSWMALN